MKFRHLLTGIMTAGLLFSSAAYAQEVRDMKFRFSLQPPKGTSQYDGSKKFADLVAEKSKGKMDVKVFEGGSIGSDAAAISSLQGGTIDFLITWTGNLSGLDKTFSLFDFPFLFKTFDEADKVIDGPVGEKLMARLPAKGLKGLAYAELGFRHIHDSKRPINKLEDLQGLKIRVMNSNLYVDFMNALGANAMAMNFTELFTALEMKTVDGATNPTDNIVSTRFYEVQKYLSLSRHMYSVMMFVMSEKTWNKLNAAEQKIVMDSAKEAGIYQRQVSRRMDKDNLVFLAKHLQVSEIPASELAKMREKSQPVVDKWSKEVGIDLYNELLAELKKVRQ